MSAGSWTLNINFGLPDERLGHTLLALTLEAEALAHGIDPKQIPRDLAEQWVTQIAAQEASRVEDIPLEKARRLAALGSFTQAGAIFRVHMADSALRVKDERDAATLRERTERQQQGGAKGGRQPKPDAQKIPENVSEVLQKLMQGGRNERDARSVLRQRYGVTPQALGKALRKKRNQT